MEKLRAFKTAKMLKSALATIFVICIIMGTSAFAARTTLYLPSGQTWVHCGTTRSTSYSYVNARCYAVYPTSGGTDGFHNIQARVARYSDLTGGYLAISSTYTLSETATGNKALTIGEGYLGLTEIYVDFRGNDADFPAYADVYYNGL